MASVWQIIYTDLGQHHRCHVHFYETVGYSPVHWHQRGMLHENLKFLGSYQQNPLLDLHRSLKLSREACVPVFLLQGALQ